MWITQGLVGEYEGSGSLSSLKTVSLVSQRPQASNLLESNLILPKGSLLHKTALQPMAFLSRDQNAFRECCGSCQGEISSSGLLGLYASAQHSFLNPISCIRVLQAWRTTLVQGAVSVGLDHSIMLYAFLRYFLLLLSK